MSDDLSNRIENARQMFAGPYNCAQSVAAAFADILKMDEDEVRRLVSGFGYGMGGERGVCGALSGGIFVLSSTVKDPANRDELYDRVYYLVSQFKKHNDGKLDCLALVGQEPGDHEFSTICPVLVETAIRLVEKSMK
jgi:C_GCAxxG_C_C family probable redox protein